MKYEELAILLPCHSLEDFPQHHEGDDAESLLASWTAMWHPALVASAQSGPTWHRADSPPQTLANRLLVVPTVGVRELPTGYAQRAKSEGACLIRKETSRQAILDQALASLDGGAGATDPELALDFMALGYCYLQVQLLTRQMRYSSNLDETHFRQMIVAAAEAAVAGQTDLARDKLSACFHLLAEERDHYYSVEVFLLDLTLVAHTTLGESLRSELLGGIPTSVLLSGELLQRMSQTEPETLNRLRNEAESQRVSLLGGDWREGRTVLQSVETALRGFQRGLRTFDACLGKRPEVFFRRRFGLGPTQPALLKHLGYHGALHFTLDDGRCPFAAQVKTHWEGVDGTVLDAIGKPPLDASKPEGFLGLATRLGETMDADHVATISFAHWPGKTSCWYQELKRVSRYCSALGKFVTIDQYFRDTVMPGHQDRFTADQYQSPYLQQSVIRREPDPISRWARYWQDLVRAELCQSLKTMIGAIRGNAIPTGPTQGNASGDGESGADGLSVDAAHLAAIDDMPESEAASSGSSANATDMDGLVREFAAVLPRKGPETPGCLVLNPLSFSRRVLVRSPELPGIESVERPVIAADETQSEKQVVVEVPPLGFAWIAPMAAAPGRGGSSRGKRPPPMAEDQILRNEFFEAVINEQTGTLQSIHVYGARGNRISQQLAVRLPADAAPRTGDTWRDPDANANYTVMAADEVRITSATTAYGEITSKGRLLNRTGAVEARFTQKYQLWRGSRVLRIDVELDLQREFLADPWNSYCACRFAWPDEAANLYRAIHEARQPAETKRIESPLYLEIEGVEERTTILTGGLPYHRRTGPRMLDTLLVVRGETARRFRLGIAIDAPQALPEALSFLAPDLHSISAAGSAPSPASSSWLFHVDAKNVVATHWEPLCEGSQMIGVRVRLRETAGRTAVARLSAFREFLKARQVNHKGETLADCAIDGGAIRLDVTAHEWLEVEARWL